jgi:cytidine deaminase
MNNSIPWEKLQKAAVNARNNAYAPYSNFYVGAAIWSDNKIYAGCNVENVSYPVGICAERSALAQMVAHGSTAVGAIIIVADKLITPCGMCRQALIEFATDIPVKLVNLKNGSSKLTSLEQLMPAPFSF